MSELKCGDVVRRKSGGFPMTVDSIVGTEVLCSWEEEGGEIKSNWYPISALLSVEEELDSFG